MRLARIDAQPTRFTPWRRACPVQTLNKSSRSNPCLCRASWEFATFFAANQQSGPFLILFCVALYYLYREKLFHLLKFGGLDDGLFFLGKECDLALGTDHAIIKHRVRPEPTGGNDVAFLAGHFVEEAYESVGIVAGLPGVLDAELVGFGFVIAAHSEQVEVERESQAVEAVLQGVIGTDAGGAARQDDRGDLS